MRVEYWQSNSDRLPPVLAFIQERTIKEQVKIAKAITLLEQQGPTLLSTHNSLLRKLSGYEFYELRILCARNHFRLFVAIDRSVAWLVHAILKKTDKTPLRDIRLVQERSNLIKSNL